MELKPGYKQTDVGVIPEDWEVKRVHQITAIKTGPFGTLLKASEYSKGDGVPLISVGEIRAGFFRITDHTPRVAEVVVRRLPQYVLKKGDIVFGRKGGVERSALIRRQHEGWFLGSDGISVRPSQECHEEFLAALFQTGRIQGWLLQNAIGTTMPSLNQQVLGNVLVPLPPTKAEQEAIAGALSDADALIESLEQLIAKKRDLKQGAMQELLTGKKRLPGFSGKWKERSFDELFSFSGGVSASRDQLSSNGHCYLHYGDIHTSSKNFIDVGAERQDIPKLNIPLSQISSGSLLDDGDVVFVDASEDDEGTSKHVVVINPGGIPFISGLHTIVAKSRTDELDHAYKRYCFQTPAIKAQFKFFSVGTKVSGISKSNIPKISFPVPPKPEQTAIAAILSDMDAELMALEAKLAKARDLKQGMMQELLTGRIRLVAAAGKVVPLPVEKAAAAKPAKAHNWQINEAVVVSVLVKHFGSEEFPLGRKRCTKLSYLMHRHVEHQAEGYLKKAAGPYNPAVKYRGPEGIAQKKRYICTHHNGTYQGFVAGEHVAEAEAYFQKWYPAGVLTWLSQFKYKKNEELELLATVDMAMEDLRRAGKPVEPAAVKQLIHDEPEWAPKLNREIFSDANIARAIGRCRELFE